jgi:hypothetical protein
MYVYTYLQKKITDFIISLKCEVKRGNNVAASCVTLD